MLKWRRRRSSRRRKKWMIFDGYLSNGKEQCVQNYSNCCVDCAHVFIPSSLFWLGWYTLSVCVCVSMCVAAAASLLSNFHSFLFVYTNTFPNSISIAYTGTGTDTQGAYTHAFPSSLFRICHLLLIYIGNFFYSLTHSSAHFAITQVCTSYVRTHTHTWERARENEIVARSKTS